VEAEKTVLIVTDGQIAVQKLADAIASALGDYAVTVVPAGAFKGTHLLGAQIVFLGASEVNPVLFTCLDKVLQHINLSGRPCGIFSPGSPDVIQYLTDMVRDSELALYHEAFLDGDISAWAASVAAQAS
jgi:hypothetical protein